MTCLFCTNQTSLLESETFFVMFDRYPVSKGHLLLIPKAHRTDYFALSIEEKDSLSRLLEEAKLLLDDLYQPSGYNIGFNCGAAAGQTIFHCHCHLIPRYAGDVPQPRGGVRGVIPAHKEYPFND